jgi:hypothetical protein
MTTTMLNGMTGISLCTQWPLTSQLQGSKKSQLLLAARELEILPTNFINELFSSPGGVV